MTWIPIADPAYICGHGAPYRAGIRPGTENRLIVAFDGGGVSWSAYTAARAITGQPASKEDDLYYTVLPEDPTGFENRGGIFSSEEWNYFRGWNIALVCYATGDLHIGCADFPYVSTDGKQTVLHHHGYRNYRLVLEKARELCSNPEKILITGVSAGGFGAAALADDVARTFPKCEDITVCVDGAMLCGDLKTIAEKIWKAPAEICDRIQSENVISDWLTALHREQGSRVRCMFACSVRDAVLSWFQSAFSGQVPPAFTQKSGELFQKNLKCMCKTLQAENPDIGLFLYDTPAGGIDPLLKLTQHTLLWDSNFKDRDWTKTKCSALDWLWNGVNGRCYHIGLEL